MFCYPAHRKGHFRGGGHVPADYNVPTAGECACPAHAADEWVRRREVWQDVDAAVCQITVGHWLLLGCCALQRSVRGGTALSPQVDRSAVRRQVDQEAPQLVQSPRRPAARHPARSVLTRRAWPLQRRHALRGLRGAEWRHAHPRTVRDLLRTWLKWPVLCRVGRRTEP